MKQVHEESASLERADGLLDKLQISREVESVAVQRVEERLERKLAEDLSYVRSLKGTRAYEYNEGYSAPTLEVLQREVKEGLDMTLPVHYAFQQVGLCLQSQEPLRISEVKLPAVAGVRGKEFEAFDLVYEIAFSEVARIVNRGARERSTVRSEAYVAKAMEGFSGWGGQLDRKTIDEFWTELDRQTAVILISTDYYPHGGPLEVIAKTTEADTRKVREDLTRDLFLRAAAGGRDVEDRESLRYSSMARAVATHYGIGVLDLGSKDEHISALV